MEFWSNPQWQTLPEVIRDNLHLVLAMSPSGSQLRGHPSCGAAEGADAPKLVGTNLTALRNEMPKLPRHGRRMYHWHLEHTFGAMFTERLEEVDWNDWITSKQKVFGQPFLLRSAGRMSRESWNRGVSLVLFLDDFCVLVALSWHPRACRDLQSIWASDSIVGCWPITAGTNLRFWILMTVIALWSSQGIVFGGFLSHWGCP